MKRRYKPGDWFRLPLDARTDALGLVSAVRGGRVAAVFFAVPRGAEADAAALRALDPREAAGRYVLSGEAFLGGAFVPVAQSLRLDPRFAPAAFPEDDVLGAQALRRRLLGARGGAPDAVTAVRAVRAGFDSRGLPEEGVLAVRVPFRGSEAFRLGAWLAGRPSLALRLHGAAVGPRDLHPFGAVRALEIAAERFEPSALAEAPAIAVLSVRTRSLAEPLGPALAALRALDELRLAGAAAVVDARLPPLRVLALEGGNPFGAGRLAAPGVLERLRLYDTALELDGLGNLVRLRTLELRRLPGFAEVAALRRLEGLEELRLIDLPHLNVADFEPLRDRCPPICTVDLGSRRKEREIYRLLGAGRPQR